MNEHDRLFELTKPDSPEHRFLASIRAAESLRNDRIAASHRWSNRLTIAAILLAVTFIITPALIHLAGSITR
jgi:hypothetical protein